MTENERNLINTATGKLFASHLNPIYASIQNYRKFLREHEGRDLTFTEATDRWVMDVEEPIMSTIYGDAVIKAAMGSMRYNLFFELLLVALSQTADGDQLLQPMFLVSRHLKDRRDRFFLGAGDESASVDDDCLCF